MQSFVIQGGRPLSGTIRASGNKNGALPILAATVLASDEVVLSNLPRIRDVEVMVELLVDLGADAAWTGPNEVRVDSSGVSKTELDPDLCREIRASFLLAGPLLARFGRAVVPPPGGDVIGRRRLDTHIHAFAELGVEMEINGAYDLRAERLVGKRMYLDEASVMGTENAIMAAVLAEGETIVGHAACEPHIQDLCRFLISLGAQIEGIGSNVLRIQGVDRLGGGAYRIGPEHVEVASFAVLAAVTGGDLTIEDVEPDDLISIVPAFRKLGIELEVGASTLRVPTGAAALRRRRPRRPDPEARKRHLARLPCRPDVDRRRRRDPGDGTVLVFEKMFESRLFFVDKLVSMGARIILCDPHRAVITGPAQLFGQRLESPDIRAGMAMVIAALCAEGTRRSATSARSIVATSGSTSGSARSAPTSNAASCERRQDRAGKRAGNVASGVPLLDHLLTEFAHRRPLRPVPRDRAGRAAAEVDAAGAAVGRAVARCSPRRTWQRRDAGGRGARDGRSRGVRPRLLASNADLTGAGGLGSDIAGRFLRRWPTRQR